jgi:sialic acid synthase SpsE
MLIAEISNAHFGNLDKAKLMIRMAHNAGADLIKGQAFRPWLIYGGSMPMNFYEEAAFNEEEYVELIHYARDLGNDLFYSIFSDDFKELESIQTWHKITGSQSKNGVKKPDSESLIVSLPAHYDVPKYEKATILHVGEYLSSDPQLWNIERISEKLGRAAGYSDHTIGIKECIRAHKDFGAVIIEKHFCLTKNEEFEGVVYRDTVFGSTPKEFEKLAGELQR